MPAHPACLAAIPSRTRAPPPLGRAPGVATPHFPAWARGKPARSQDLDAIFRAGAALAALDSFAREDQPWAGCWRHRLALAAAVASLPNVGRREDEAALRDAWCRPGADPGPAGRVLLGWRLLAARSSAPTAAFIGTALEALGVSPHNETLAILALVEAEIRSEKSALVSAAAIATQMAARRPDAAPLALWLADLVLAKKLRWAFPIPLLATGLAGLPQGSRRRPAEPDWLFAVARAYAQAAAAAHDQAALLAIRAAALRNAAPKLRAKQAGAIIAALLAEDAVAPATMVLTKTLSDRAARRLFERLAALGLVRELTGRPTFRLYGL